MEPKEKNVYNSGVSTNSSYYSFTPSEMASKYLFYPIWCGHYFCNFEYFIKRDYFPYLLLVYVRKGEFFVEYRDQLVTARKGDVILIDCQEPHYYYAADGLEFLYIHFDGSNARLLCQYIMGQFGILYQGENTTLIGKVLFQIMEANQHNHIIPSSESSQLIYQMLMMLTQQTHSTSKDTSPVETAIKFIRSKVGQKITLLDLAQLTNLSIYYISHIFKAQTGYSPLEYVISTRLDTAKILLKTTNLSISEIADRVGYNNIGSFTNVFIKKIGCSPKAFRLAQI